MTDPAVKVFKHVVRVYYEDTDCLGTVYHAKYLHFMERARTEMLLEVGLTNRVIHEQGILFFLRRSELEYLRPAKLNDQLMIETRISAQRKVGITFEQVITKVDAVEQIICVGHNELVFTNQAMKPIAIPQKIIEVFLHGS